MHSFIYFVFKHWHLLLSCFVRMLLNWDFSKSLMSLTWMNVSQLQCIRYVMYVIWSHHNFCRGLFLCFTHCHSKFHSDPIPGSSTEPPSHLYLLTSCKHQNQQRLGASYFAQFSFDHTHKHMVRTDVVCNSIHAGHAKRDEPTVYTHHTAPATYDQAWKRWLCSLLLGFFPPLLAFA